MAVDSLKITYKDYCLLPEDKRYELIGGKLYMTPAPSVVHQMVSRNLGIALYEYVKEMALGEVLFAPVDVVLSEHDVVQPDIIFISNERRSIITEANIKGAPDLVVEVLSPSTSDRDLVIKKKLYADHGVREIWFVHPVVQTIEVVAFDAGGEKKELYARRAKAAFASTVFPGLELDLNQVF